MSDSILTNHQEKSFTKELQNGDVIVATIRFDDRCNNGYNTFSITGEIYDRSRIPGEACIVNSKGKKRYLGSCGCIHKDIIKHFPELKHLIKWHLCSTNGPMHYIANTIYWTEQNNLDYARNTAIAPDATIEQLSNKNWLINRLPNLIQEFKNDMIAIGFSW